MEQFYRKNFPQIEVFTFTLPVLIRELLLETKPVIFLTTASLSYDFGVSQLRFLRSSMRLL